MSTHACLAGICACLQVNDEVTRYNTVLQKFLDAQPDEWEAIVTVYRGDLQKPFFEHMQVSAICNQGKCLQCCPGWYIQPCTGRSSLFSDQLSACAPSPLLAGKANCKAYSICCKASLHGRLHAFRAALCFGGLQCLLVAAKDDQEALDRLVMVNTRLVALCTNYDSIEKDEVRPEGQGLTGAQGNVM